MFSVARARRGSGPTAPIAFELLLDGSPPCRRHRRVRLRRSWPGGRALRSRAQAGIRSAPARVRHRRLMPPSPPGCECLCSRAQASLAPCRRRRRLADGAACPCRFWPRRCASPGLPLTPRRCTGLPAGLRSRAATRFCDPDHRPAWAGARNSRDSSCRPGRPPPQFLPDAPTESTARTQKSAGYPALGISRRSIRGLPSRSA